MNDAEVSMAASAPSPVKSAGEAVLALRWTDATSTARVPAEAWRTEEISVVRRGGTEAAAGASIESGWSPVRVTVGRYAASTAPTPQAVDHQTALEMLSAACVSTTVADDLSVASLAGASGTPTGSVGAAATGVPTGSCQRDRMTADGTAGTEVSEATNIIYPLCARYSNAIEKAIGSSSAWSLPSSGADAEKVLPEPSFVFLPRCSVVQAVLAVRTNLEQQEEQYSHQGQQQLQQVPQQHLEERSATEEQRQLQHHDVGLQQALKEGDGQRQLEQQEGNPCSSSSESSRRGHGNTTDIRGRSADVGVGDDCAEHSSRDTDRTHRVHRKKKGWGREDADDPILTDFSSLEQEVFPYPLPCCSFFELLASDKQPFAVSGQTIRQGRSQPSGEPQEATNYGKTGISPWLQAGAEQGRSDFPEERLHMGREPTLQQQDQQDVAQHQQHETKSEQAQSELRKKKNLFFTRAYSADTAVYAKLLKRHFSNQKNSTVEGSLHGDPLPAKFGHEYLNFRPAPTFEVTELRPQTFRERVAAIQADIESLSIPPPPCPCPLRFSKFISHAQKITAACGAAPPSNVPGETATDVGNTTAAGTPNPARNGATADTIAADGMMTADVSLCPVSAAGVVSHSSADPQNGFAKNMSLFQTLNGVAVTLAQRKGADVAVQGIRILAQTTQNRAESNNKIINASGCRPVNHRDSACSRWCAADVDSSSLDKCYYSLTSTAAVSFSPKKSTSFSSIALQDVARYFGIFAGSGVRVPSLEEAVACAVAEELRWWPDFLDATTAKLLKDALAHSKARRFNRFPCRIAWPPIPPLCTYSEDNLKYSMRELVKLRTYALVQDYYHTRFHRETSIHNFSVDQHAIEQRKLAAAESRCRQKLVKGRLNKTQQPKQQHLHQAGQAGTTRQQGSSSLQQQELQAWRVEEETGQRDFRREPVQTVQPLVSQRLPEGPAQQDKQHVERKASYAEKADDEAKQYDKLHFSFFAKNVMSGTGPGSPSFVHRELEYFRRVSKDEAIVSVAFYHAVRGTKLAAFDVLATQTLLDIRTAFLGCCEAESEPGIPVFPGSCFLIDGILYPDTYHASSGPEYAETIAEHLSGSGKLARKMQIHSFRGNGEGLGNHVESAEFGHSAAGGEVRIIRPQKRLDGSLRIVRSALPQRSSSSAFLHDEQHQLQKNSPCFPSSSHAKSTKSRREVGYSRDGQQEVVRYEDSGLAERNTARSTESTGGRGPEELPFDPSLTRRRIDEACSEDLEDDEEGNDWVMIPQHKAILNNMQLPLRSLECFVHQGTCEHRVIFWNIRQFDPQRDCCYVAAYPVRTYKPSSKTITCQACEEHLACKGVLNSVLCSVHNPTYLCENCYRILFGGVAGRRHVHNSMSPGPYPGGRALSAAPPDKGGIGESTTRKDGTSVTEDGTDGEHDDDPDPFALHFDVYDG